MLNSPLHALHLELGAKLVAFAGYELPLSYAGGIISEHLHTRESASLFDVSHMGQIALVGSGAAAALESCVPSDVVGLPAQHQRYSVLTNDDGGIRDDLMISNYGDRLLLVVNAACKHADHDYLGATLADHCRVEMLGGRALLAIQGPAAAAALAPLAPAAAGLDFMAVMRTELAGAQIYISRSGYTGEDGFEISVAAEDAVEVARRLLDSPAVKPAGLGARDSLRLEAGLCLYGHDIDETTSPVEAALAWVISKSRRTGGARPGRFPGERTIFEQLHTGVARVRVGLKPEGRAPIREGTALNDANGKRVGTVTSGGFGPSLGGPCAMAYVDSRCRAVGTVLRANVRGKERTLHVAELPFVPHKYRR